MTNINNKRFDILGVKISAIDMADAWCIIDTLVAKKQKGYVCVCPVSTIVECNRNEDYRNLVNNAAIVTPDGMPTVWIARARGLKHVERVYGPDLMLAVCQLCEQKGYKQYFYGGTEKVLAKLQVSLKSKFPNLKISGAYSPPFRELTKEEDIAIVNRINTAAPDILWVGIGAPRQDFWMVNHQAKLNVPVMLGVGAAFDFLSGVKPQAPRWIQRSGLEWFFRLCTEPHRLWKRYLIGNSIFVYLLVKSLFRNKS